MHQIPVVAMKGQMEAGDLGKVRESDKIERIGAMLHG
jgi:hypothetical protein